MRRSPASAPGFLFASTPKSLAFPEDRPIFCHSAAQYFVIRSAYFFVIPQRSGGICFCLLHDDRHHSGNGSICEDKSFVK
jgi:hypothetical protein